MRIILISLLFLYLIELKGQSTEPVGKIYISQDHGASWSRSDNGFPSEDVVNTWVSKGDQIFAGTDKHGVMMFSVKGNTWSTSLRGLPSTVRITALFANSEMILAGTFEHGIYASLDDGSSWQSYNAGINNLTIRAFHEKGNNIYVGTNDGVYSFSNINSKWVKIGGDYQVNDFASDDQYLYVATHVGVFRSPAAALNWKQVYRNSAAFKIVIEANEVSILDYSGNVHYANTKQLVWFKDEKYMPIRHSYQLTPTSRKILIPAPGIHNIILTTPPNGLPLNTPFNNLLRTPFGLFASAVSVEGC